jgi:hypothetical protein
MENQRKQRLEPRMVFALVLVAIPVLYVVAHVIVIRSGPDCGDGNGAEVGGIAQMFVPGAGCAEPPARR